MIFTINITTNFATLIYEYDRQNGYKLINYLATSISKKIHESKNLFTDGTQRPFYSKTEIIIFQDYEPWFSFDVNPSNIELITFSNIAWELKNKLPSQFAELFKIPWSGSIFTKKEHWHYVQVWLDKKITNQKIIPKKQKKSKQKRSPWIKIKSTGMQN